MELSTNLFSARNFRSPNYYCSGFPHLEKPLPRYPNIFVHFYSLIFLLLASPGQSPSPHQFPARKWTGAWLFSLAFESEPFPPSLLYVSFNKWRHGCIVCRFLPSWLSLPFLHCRPAIEFSHSPLSPWCSWCRSCCSGAPWIRSLPPIYTLDLGLWCSRPQRTLASLLPSWSHFPPQSCSGITEYTHKYNQGIRQDRQCFADLCRYGNITAQHLTTSLGFVHCFL